MAKKRKRGLSPRIESYKRKINRRKGPQRRRCL
jgi:hypothetical protein